MDLRFGDGWLPVGYLSRENAEEYQQVLLGVRSRGQLPAAEARLCRARGGPLAVYLHLNEPDACVMANALPGGARPLPPERQCAVTGEAKHQPALQPWAPTGDRSSHVWATLHTASVPAGKHAGDPTIEVRINGQRVGALSGPQGQRYANVLASGRMVACEASVHRGGSGLEVRLYLPKVD